MLLLQYFIFWYHKVGVSFGAYGSGENPVISGSMEITGWSQQFGNIYVADVSNLLPVDGEIQYLFVNNRRVLLARYPNVDSPNPDPDAGWLEVDSSSNKRSFVDPALATYNKPNGYWVGGNVRIRTFSWLFETRKVTTSSNGGAITMESDLTQTLASSIQPGWGYYIDNIRGELDYENEYYFDPAEKKVYLYAPGGVDPNTVTVEGSIYDIGCLFDWHYRDMSIDSLTFRHHNIEGVQILTCDGVEIRNSNFENIGHIAINNAWNSVDMVLENNNISDVLEFGIKVNGTTDDKGFPVGASYIENNTIKNTGIIAGYGGSGVARACGIRTYGIRGLTIRNNIIENTGYVGMQLEGGGQLVENNFVTRSLLTLDDGGGIFVNSPNNIIRGNVVTETWGNRGPSSGTHNGGNFDNNQMGMGIFFQPNLSGNVVSNNTFANNRSHGIYPDRASNTTIQDNVCYNNGSGAYHGSQLYLKGTTGTSHNNTMIGNILVSKRADQYGMRTDTSSSIGTYDNDVICTPAAMAAILNGSVELSLSAWQNSGNNRDENAKGCPPLTAPVSRILTNTSNETKAFHLGDGPWYDAYGEVTEPEITLAPYGSTVVFQEEAVYYSLGKLIVILQVLVNEEGPTLITLDINQDKHVDLVDAIQLMGILEGS